MHIPTEIMSHAAPLMMIVALYDRIGASWNGPATEQGTEKKF